eukprot:g76990.t1
MWKEPSSLYLSLSRRKALSFLSRSLTSKKLLLLLSARLSNSALVTFRQLHIGKAQECAADLKALLKIRECADLGVLPCKRAYRYIMFINLRDFQDLLAKCNSPPLPPSRPSWMLIHYLQRSQDSLSKETKIGLHSWLQDSQIGSKCCSLYKLIIVCLRASQPGGTSLKSSFIRFNASSTDSSSSKKGGPICSMTWSIISTDDTRADTSD